MQQITLQPTNEQQMRLIKQLAKTLEIGAIVQKETPKQKRKREILDSIERGVDEMNAHLRGEIKLKSADEFLKEL